MEMDTRLADKLDSLLEKIAKLDGTVISVANNVNYLSKILEMHQERLDEHIKGITGEISELQSSLAVSQSKIFELEKDKDKRSQVSSKSVAIVITTACSFIASLVMNIILLFLKKT